MIHAENGVVFTQNEKDTNDFNLLNAAAVNNSTARDLMVMLTAAQHYAKKLEANQEPMMREGRRVHYARTINRLLTTLQEEMTR